jgi:hypothetical protein
MLATFLMCPGPVVRTVTGRRQPRQRWGNNCPAVGELYPRNYASLACCPITRHVVKRAIQERPVV